MTREQLERLKIRWEIEHNPDREHVDDETRDVLDLVRELEAASALLERMQPVVDRAIAWREWQGADPEESLIAACDAYITWCEAPL